MLALFSDPQKIFAIGFMVFASAGGIGIGIAIANQKTDMEHCFEMCNSHVREFHIEYSHGTAVHIPTPVCICETNQ